MIIIKKGQEMVRAKRKYTKRKTTQEIINQSKPSWSGYIFAGVLILGGMFVTYEYVNKNNQNALIYMNQKILSLTDAASSLTLEKPTTFEPKAEATPVPDKVVTGPPDAWKKVLEAKPYYLRALRNDGKIELRTGGNSSWRYNNPGKLVHGNFTREHKALGSDGKHAIFASLSDGEKANYDLLFSPDEAYSKLTIKEAMKKYAPSDDGYNPTKYAQNIAKAINVSVDTVLAQLSEEKKQGLLEAIKKEEKYTKGKVKIFDSEEDWRTRGW